MATQHKAIIDGVLNFHREQIHPGSTLEFFSMGPSGRSSILELTDDWHAYKPDEKDGLGPTVWIVIVDNVLFTDNIRKLSASVQINGRDLKNVTWRSDFGQMGRWRAVVEFV